MSIIAAPNFQFSRVVEPLLLEELDARDGLGSVIRPPASD